MTIPYSTLSGEGAKTFEKIYNNALKEYKGDKKRAAQTAWAGLKTAGYSKGSDGQWTKKSDALSSFTLVITKASFDKSDQKMRFRAVASDTDKDLYGESMTPELFKSFVDRIDKNTPVPEQFKSAICEDSWCGGMPYPSISHYRGGTNGNNVPGNIESVYIDGNRLKSVGVLNDTPLGHAVFKSLCEDLYAKEKSEAHDPVRISIGFLDLKHEHRGNGMHYVFERKSLNEFCPMCLKGVGNKYYLDGILVHEAFTRVPVNPRTEAEVERSMTVTKREDAAGIVGKDLAELLEEKSLSDDVLIIKSDGEIERAVTSMPVDSDTHADGKTLKLVGADVYNQCYDPNTGLFDNECIKGVMTKYMPNWRNMMQSNDGSKKPDSNPMIPSNTVSKSKVTKKEPDGEHPSSHYLVVGDPSKPTTWHLPVKDSSGKISTRHLGAAHAALTKGFRGQKYGGPNKGEALAKLKRLYHSAGMEWPEDSKKEKSMAGKVGNVKVPGNPEMIEPFETIEDELYPAEPSLEVDVNPEAEGGSKEMGDPAGTYSNVGKARMASEAEEEAEDEEDGKDGKKAKKSMKEKSLVLAAKAVINEVVKQKSQGVYGDQALVAIQPFMNTFGEMVRRSVTSQSIGGADLQALIQQAVAPLTQEVAVLRAQLAAANGNGTVARSNAVPNPRSLSVVPFTADLINKSIVPNQTQALTNDPNVKFAQIQALAKKSVGL